MSTSRPVALRIAFVAAASFALACQAAGPERGQPLAEAEIPVHARYIMPNGEGLPPGKGTAKEGEGCQTGLCAPGYTCLKLVNQCKKLCHVDQPADCPGGACIGGSGEYPDGFGTCTEGDGYN